jgi:4-azaleucine resistance transporter AzlC
MHMAGQSKSSSFFREGVASIAPILIGIVPFGLIYGVAAVEAGIDPVPAIAMSSIVFAGASQLAMVDLIGGNAALAVIVATALVINARMLMYSAALTPLLRDLSFADRLLAGYLITDQAFAVTAVRFTEPIEDRKLRRAFYLGSAIPLWVTWQISTTVGVVLGASIPDEWSLEFAIPMVFLALLVPAIKDTGTRVAAAVSGVVAVIAAPLAFNAGLITAAIAGIVAGLLAEGRS